jgi:hypothetical protein
MLGNLNYSTTASAATCKDRVRLFEESCQRRYRTLVIGRKVASDFTISIWTHFGHIMSSSYRTVPRGTSVVSGYRTYGYGTVR